MKATATWFTRSDIWPKTLLHRSARNTLGSFFDCVISEDSVLSACYCDQWCHLVLPVVVESRVAFDLVGSSQHSSAAAVTSLFGHGQDGQDGQVGQVGQVGQDGQVGQEDGGCF